MYNSQVRNMEKGNLTKGGITSTMLKFAFPLMLGNMLQQCYNIADTLIVGRVLGANALAAVGSSYSLMVFITSVFIGLCMGSGAVFSMQYGSGDISELKKSIFSSAMVIGGVTVVLNILSLVLLEPIINLLNTPHELTVMVYDYLFIILLGMIPVSIANFYSFLLRSIGDSFTPLLFLILSVVMNIFLDIAFIVWIDWGIKGAAIATVASQAMAAAGMYVYTHTRLPELNVNLRYIKDFVLNSGSHKRQSVKESVKRITEYSFLTCMQQSVMNFGILMVQGLVNSFGSAVMAAFAVAVKIDSFAYMPAQDFGNAFSTFIAQNYGAGKKERIMGGIKSAVIVTTIFCLLVSVLVYIFAPQLMAIFVKDSNPEIVGIGAEYLRIEGSFYAGIGWLFLLYGFYRAVTLPKLSLVLTVLSLGTRVILAYLLASIPSIGYHGIWWSVPIGWAIADIAGTGYFYKRFIKGNYFIKGNSV